MEIILSRMIKVPARRRIEEVLFITPPLASWVPPDPPPKARFIKLTQEIDGNSEISKFANRPLIDGSINLIGRLWG